MRKWVCLIGLLILIIVVYFCFKSPVKDFLIVILAIIFAGTFVSILERDKK